MLARELDIRTILIPQVSSAFYAFGEILSDMKHTYLSSCVMRLSKMDYGRANQILAAMEARGRQESAEVGVPPEQMTVRSSLDLRYVDQIHECQVDMPIFGSNKPGF